jgi:hypothetical protein
MRDNGWNQASSYFVAHFCRGFTFRLSRIGGIVSTRGGDSSQLCDYICRQLHFTIIDSNLHGHVPFGASYLGGGITDTGSGVARGVHFLIPCPFSPVSLPLTPTM